MPTDGGLLRKGDRLERRGHPALFVITERLGGFTDYAVRVARADGQLFSNGHRMVSRMLLTDAHRRIMLGRDRDWRLLADDEPPPGVPDVVRMDDWLAAHGRARRRRPA